MNILSFFIIVPLLMLASLWASRSVNQVRGVMVVGSSILLALSVYLTIDYIELRIGLLSEVKDMAQIQLSRDTIMISQSVTLRLAGKISRAICLWWKTEQSGFLQEINLKDISWYLKKFEYLFSKNWFYDFVKKEKILCTAESECDSAFLLPWRTKEKRKKVVSKNTCKFPLFLSLYSFLHTKSMNDLLDKSQKNKERRFELWVESSELAQE